MAAPSGHVFRGTARGFTLVEVVIVVAIIGILMALVLPGYQDSLQKGRRSDAKAGLMDAANRQERYMLDRSTYTADLMKLGYAEDPAISEEAHYTIDVAVDPNCPIETCYILTATPVAGGVQAEDKRCTKFLLDSNGARSAEGSAATECW